MYTCTSTTSLALTELGSVVSKSIMWLFRMTPLGVINFDPKFWFNDLQSKNPEASHTYTHMYMYVRAAVNDKCTTNTKSRFSAPPYEATTLCECVRQMAVTR